MIYSEDYFDEGMTPAAYFGSGYDIQQRPTYPNEKPIKIRISPQQPLPKPPIERQNPLPPNVQYSYGPLGATLRKFNY